MRGTALVTGGTGFVGSHLVEALADAGWTVRALVRRPDTLRWLEGLPADIIEGDVQNPDSLPEALQGVELVIHCAALTKAITRNEYMQANADGTRTLLKSSIQAGVRRFVYCSSQAAAGTGTLTQPRVEEDAPEPLTDYGASKLAGEIAVQEATNDIEWIILRPPALFGPRDEQFISLFRGIKKIHRYPVFGREERSYSWLYVRDLVSALQVAAETSVGLRQIYFVAHEAPVTWQEMSQIAGEFLNIDVRPLPSIPLSLLKGVALICEMGARLRGKAALLNRQKLAEIAAPGWVVSSEKITRELGFRCKFNLRESLSETLEWYKEQGWL
jgi:nucleoside-diphosphate-sugar epimerase